jgi:hypothetical protein
MENHLMTMKHQGARDIGFLGPEYLGLGLFSRLPEAQRTRFRAWLTAERREFRGDQYASRDYPSFVLHQAFKRLRGRAGS